MPSASTLLSAVTWTWNESPCRRDGQLRRGVADIELVERAVAAAHVSRPELEHDPGGCAQAPCRVERLRQVTLHQRDAIAVVPVVATVLIVLVHDRRGSQFVDDLLRVARVGGQPLRERSQFIRVDGVEEGLGRVAGLAEVREAGIGGFAPRRDLRLRGLILHLSGQLVQQVAARSDELLVEPPHIPARRAGVQQHL